MVVAVLTNGCRRIDHDCRRLGSVAVLVVAVSTCRRSDVSPDEQLSDLMDGDNETYRPLQLESLHYKYYHLNKIIIIPTRAHGYADMPHATSWQRKNVFLVNPEYDSEVYLNYVFMTPTLK